MSHTSLWGHIMRRDLLPTIIAGLLISVSPIHAADRGFQIEEATIDSIQGAIKSGQVTCKGVVQAYLDRAKAYNGICTAMVTPDGAPVPAVSGLVRAGVAAKFPTVTRAASSFLPNVSEYQGPPLDYGHMETTASDPAVQQQYGMVVGLKDAGQVNALESINIRGERSVSCKASCDTNPTLGPNPAICPPACDAFRRQPDALERAAQLDAQYGRRPDLAKLPMYCAVVTVKDWYDVKDIRSTGGNDVAFAMDAAPRDATVVGHLRDKGAIIYAVTIAAEVTHGANGPATAAKSFIGGGGSIRSSWAGHVCSPYDTERSAGPSSGGAGAAVSTNLATCSVCETTGGSCREPANQNAAPSFVTTKGLTSEDGTATAQHINHRPGAICRTLGDAARMVDAMKDTKGGTFDTRDAFTATPKALLPKDPYASYAVAKAGATALKGLRVGIVREYMVKHTPNDAAISDAVDREIKAVLRDKLGAEIVESIDPKYPDDPGVPNMKYTFADAFAETIPINAPEYFYQMEGNTPEFAVPGYDVRSRDYLVKLSLRKAPLSDKLNMRRILGDLDNTARDAFSMARYLMDRGDAKIPDWAAYAANSKWRSEQQAVASRNAVTQNVQDIRATRGIDRVKMHTVFKMAILKAMRENNIDIFVHPNVGLPQWKIGTDREPTVDGRAAAGPSITDLLGSPEISVPAGFNQVVFDPKYELSADKKSYRLVAGAERGALNHPMPFSIVFWAGPGDEPVVLKVASAYEAATHHRAPPQGFGPLTAP